jgi:hypothetical protein
MRRGLRHPVDQLHERNTLLILFSVSTVWYRLRVWEECNKVMWDWFALKPHKAKLPKALLLTDGGTEAQKLTWLAWPASYSSQLKDKAALPGWIYPWGTESFAPWATLASQWHSCSGEAAQGHLNHLPSAWAKTDMRTGLSMVESSILRNPWLGHMAFVHLPVISKVLDSEFQQDCQCAKTLECSVQSTYQVHATKMILQHPQTPLLVPCGRFSTYNWEEGVVISTSQARTPRAGVHFEE